MRPSRELVSALATGLERARRGMRTDTQTRKLNPRRTIAPAAPMARPGSAEHLGQDMRPRQCRPVSVRLLTAIRKDRNGRKAGPRYWANLSTIGRNADRIDVPLRGLTGIDYNTACLLTTNSIKNVYHILPPKQRKLAWRPFGAGHNVLALLLPFPVLPFLLPVSLIYHRNHFLIG